MLRFQHTKKGSAQARKARKKIKTIAGRLQRELRRNLSDVEFGSKSSIFITQNTGVIVGALNFNENIHDSKTLEPVLEQYERLNDRKPKEVYADRGYRGRKYVNDVAIRVPTPDKKHYKGTTQKVSLPRSHRTSNQSFEVRLSAHQKFFKRISRR